MSDISALPSGIVEWLSGREELEYINFLTEFPPIKKAVPLKKTTVAVGIKTMEIVDAFVENADGILERDEFCRNAKITLRLSIHAPYSSGGKACHDAFTDIIDCLTFESSLHILTSGCDDIISDRDTDAFVLSAWAQVEANLCPAATSELPLPSFFNKDLLCGSHIRDTDIHLSTEQQNFLASPILTGTYIGSGDSSETVNLGYKPKFVYIMRLGMPMFEYSNMDSTNHVISAIGVDRGCSLGLTLTSSGFRVENSDAYQESGIRIRLNEYFKTYIYFVIK